MKKLFALVILFFSNVVFSQETPYKLLILWSGLGEYEWAKRLEKSCHNLGWEASLSYWEEKICPTELLALGNYAEPISVEQRIDQFNPDLIVSLKEEQIFSSKIPHYIAISGCWEGFFDPDFRPDEKVLPFAGILYTSPAIHSLKAFFEASGKPFNGIPWYPSCPATPYQPVTPKKLFYCGFQWDDKRTGQEYSKMFSLLDEQGYFIVYGPPERWMHTPHSIQGLLPFDGESVSKAIRDAGVALIIHTHKHNELEAPSARIFEAASSCSVIISERHPFIVREFGDTVLYFDGTKNGEELFAQIDAHMQWIFSHPAEAKALAGRSHAIFVEKFTLERQLQNLIALHETILSH